MKVKAHVIITGRVQGVYFRGHTRREAQKYGVNGWVRNLPDGRVEAIFEGEKEDVDRTIESIKMGPPHAKVTDLDLEWLNYDSKFDDFTIRY